MKNSDIGTLTEGGIQNITTCALSASDAYKVYKFKRAIDKAFNNIIEMHKDILMNSGIENIEEFQDKYKKLYESAERTLEEEKEFDEIKKKDFTVSKLIKELYDDSSELDIKPLSYESWHALQVENKDIKVLSYCEPCLEGVLWVAPEE